MAVRYYQVPQTFSEWRKFARYTLDDCVKVFEVSPRTIKNWETGKIQPPRAVFICLQLFSGRLDFIGKEWRGFRILPDCIESEAGDFVRAHEIKALRYAMQAVGMQRDRRCRMNENRKGIVEPLDIANKPYNVTLIDEAPKKAKTIKTSKKDESLEKPISVTRYANLPDHNAFYILSYHK